MVSSARKKMPFTHFVSIPLTTPNVKTCFNQFKTEVLQFSRGVSSCMLVCRKSLHVQLRHCFQAIDEGLFQYPEKLHLTIGTLVLLTDDERVRAAQTLQSCKSRFRYESYNISIFLAFVSSVSFFFYRDIIGTSPIEVQIQGVEYMNDDPEKVDVLYGKCIENSGRLQKLTDAVVDSLEDEGLLDRQYDHVKLHATLMNSIFKVKDDSQDHSMRSTFNAKPILEVLI